jgi:peptidoglycan-associated lipoprotein
MKLSHLAVIALAATGLAACSSSDGDKGGVNGNGLGAGDGGTNGAPYGDIQAGGRQAQQAELTNQVGDTIHFGTDSSDVSGEARATLQRQAAFAQKYPNLTFTIEGHCDERGTREYNLALGERRATATKNALASLGVAAARLQTISYGKERPVAVGSSASAWAQNRRAVTVIN